MHEQRARSLSNAVLLLVAAGYLSSVAFVLTCQSIVPEADRWLVSERSFSTSWGRA